MTQHDTTAPPVTASTTDGCLSANCHPTSNLHAIHGDAAGCNLTGCHDFSLQAAKPTATTCGTGGACHNSGGLHTYNHNSTASQECIDCHEQTDVSTLHANCAVCHRNPSYPSLPAGRTNECTGCHNGTVVGTHAYTPHDPQHYNPATTQHTASAQTGSESGYACTQCHSLEMKPAHNGPTNITFNLSGYADKCVACHEVVVDNFAGSWDKTCVRCHTTRHTQTATKHDATAQVLASPGSRYGGSSVGPGFSDGFEAGSFRELDERGLPGTQRRHYDPCQRELRRDHVARGMDALDRYASHSKHYGQPHDRRRRFGADRTVGEQHDGALLPADLQHGGVHLCAQPELLVSDFRAPHQRPLSRRLLHERRDELDLRPEHRDDQRGHLDADHLVGTSGELGTARSFRARAGEQRLDGTLLLHR